MQSFLAKHKIRDKILAVGVSGGADSLALVLMAKQELSVLGYEIIALTVNHKLRPNADTEAAYVAEVMAKHHIKHYILEWDGPKPQNGVEESARLARYSLLRNWCLEHSVHTLLMAHHKQDQAETFLMRLQRGSGLEGLCAIREVSNWNGITILRPLLNYEPEQLKEFLRRNNVEWKEDESNTDTKYLRNRVRKFLPQMEQKIDLNIDKISMAVQNLQSAESFIEEQIEQIMAKQVICYDNVVFCIKYTDFLNWHQEVRFRILSKLCRKEYIPRAESTLQAIVQMKSLPFNGITLGGKEIFIAYKQIFIVPELNAKRIPTKDRWKKFTENHVEYKNISLPHKAKAAILEKVNDL